MKQLQIMLNPIFLFSMATLCLLSAAALFREENYLVGYPYAAGAVSLFCVGMMAIILKKVTALVEKIDIKMDKSEAICKEGIKEIDILLTKMHRELDALSSEEEEEEDEESQEDSLN